MSRTSTPPDHPFAGVDWMRGCGHLNHPQADRCGRPAAEHVPYEAAHVLSWLPPYLDDGKGCWELRTIAAWNAQVRKPPFAELDAPRDVSVGLLVQWAADLCGYPPCFRVAEQKMRRLSTRRWTTEPVYYVRRAS
jgi:hypothetical protein